MNHEIGKKIRIGLVRSGFTQKKVAKIMNVSNKSISSWCTGNSTPPGDKLLTLIKVINAEDLFLNSESLTKEFVNGDKNE